MKINLKKIYVGNPKFGGLQFLAWTFTLIALIALFKILF